MDDTKIFLDDEEILLLEDIESGEWIEKPLSESELNKYKKAAEYTGRKL